MDGFNLSEERLVCLKRDLSHRCFFNAYQARRKIENEKNQAGRNDDFNYCFCPIFDVFDFCFQYYIQTKILKIIGSSSR